MLETWHIHHGDSLLWLPTLPAESVDALICDPPYSSGGQFRGDRMGGTAAKYLNSDQRTLYPEFGGDTRDQRGFFAWCTLWLTHAMHAMRPGAAFGVFIDWRQYPVLTDAIQAAGLNWRGTVVWDKTEGARPQPGRPRAQAEFLVWGSKGPWTLAGPPMPGVFRFAPMAGGAKQHIAGKPLPLMEALMPLCPEGGLVLDPFAGSGTTGLAALNTGRRFLGCEMSADYHAIACRRLAEQPAQTKLFA